MSTGAFEEVDPSGHMIVDKIQMTRRLIQQQERIINLLEKIVPENQGFPFGVGNFNSSINKETKMEQNVDSAANDSAKDDDVVAPMFEEICPEKQKRRLRLYRAALNGNWEVAKHIYHDDQSIGDDISRRGDTALHIAAAAKHIDFVKELVERMNENDLKKQNTVGSTALFFAAASGKVELAQEIMKKNKEIAKIRDTCGTLPIDIAAWLGHKKMVEFLYRETKHSLTENDCKNLFITCIKADFYGFALQLLENYPDLATARAENNETALHVLARKCRTFTDFANQNHGGIFKRCFQLGVKDAENKEVQAVKLVKRIWQKVVLSRDNKISELIAKPRKLIFDAAEGGNVEFLSILIREYPDLIWKIDNQENRYTIFHIAVKNRQENVFRLIYEIGSIKELLLASKDNDDNNILHLAGRLAPLDRLDIISGEALQLQRELLWFKQVEKLVRQEDIEQINKEGLTPRALFTKEHKPLREKGEKWMKETAQSCIVVATLIATVAFAAAITVPGGNNQDTGFPTFIQKVAFQIFVISNAISLVLSLTSIATFLNILTSRYAEEDFLWMLPNKLHIGMLSLSVSLGALLVVFSTTSFLFFNSSRLWIAILVAVIAPIPVIMFMVQIIQILREVLHSVFLFRPAKDNLFSIELESSENCCLVVSRCPA